MRASVGGAAVVASAGTAVEIRVYTRVGLVGKVAVVWACIGGGSVGVVVVGVTREGILDLVYDVGHVCLGSCESV